MTSLNSKLQLAVLNRKKGRNLLEKGFTLVELMIVIVIVGILSAVALPNFLSQTEKAKASECVQQLGAFTKEAYALTQAGTTTTAVSEMTAGSVLTANNAAGICTYSVAVNGTTASTIDVVATGVTAFTGKKLNACVATATGQRDVKTTFGTAASC